MFYDLTLLHTLIIFISYNSSTAALASHSHFELDQFFTHLFDIKKQTEKKQACFEY